MHCPVPRSWLWLLPPRPAPPALVPGRWSVTQRVSSYVLESARRGYEARIVSKSRYEPRYELPLVNESFTSLVRFPVYNANGYSSLILL